MDDIKKAKCAFKEFLKKYEKQNDFSIIVVHTYHVLDNSRLIANKLELSNENIYLAELIALLHDVGRFEEKNFISENGNVSFNHASYGCKMLFSDGLIRNFISNDCYDELIEAAINNHNRLNISVELDEKQLMHAKIIRDADKLDNLRIKTVEKMENIFPGKVKDENEMINGLLSDNVYETILNKKCIDNNLLKLPLDYWAFVLAFVFDLNYKESFEIVKNNDYINLLIDRFPYKDLETSIRMENIRKVINDFINEKVS